MYPICYRRVSGRYFQPEPAMYSRCFRWFPGPLTPSVTDLKKEVTKQQKEMADVVDQDSLIELKSRRPIRFPEVFVHPALDRKWLPGEVEIHQNGLQYQLSMSLQKIGNLNLLHQHLPRKTHGVPDILFSNIKHLFFQPCDHELLVIVHIHLKSNMREPHRPIPSYSLFV